MAKSKTTRTRTSGKTSTSSSDNSWIEPAIDIGLTVATKALPKIWDSIFGSGDEPKEQERTSYDYDRSKEDYNRRLSDIENRAMRDIRDMKEEMAKLKEQTYELAAYTKECEDTIDYLDNQFKKLLDHTNELNDALSGCVAMMESYENSSGWELIKEGFGRMFGSKPFSTKKMRDELHEKRKAFVDDKKNEFNNLVGRPKDDYATIVDASGKLKTIKTYKD